MQMNISDLEEVVRIVNKLPDLERPDTDASIGAGSQIIIDNANGYRIGTLIFDGDFWTFNPEGYGKTDE